MNFQGKATRIKLFDFTSPQMRAFHLSWFAFFLCFFAWFGIAPLMPMVRAELELKPWQIGNLVIASVSATIFARLLIGRMLDSIGPRYAYTGLLCLCSIPVMAVGFAHDYWTLLLFRTLIGVIGASFVITQYHTSIMFAPNCVGTANATSAGWGNLGGGVTQQVMPLLTSFLLWMGVSQFFGWRIAMFVAGAVCFLTGIAYFFLTQDAPEGNFRDLRAAGKMPKREHASGTFLEACRDVRVWALFVIYGACFGIELTINNMAATYFYDNFGLGLTTAGLVAGLFGLMNIFARTLGGYYGDKFGIKWGLSGRVRWLFITLFCEGIALIIFSQMTTLGLAIGTMILFSLFVQMSEGATYSVVPFINKRALGSVAGIVGAGGNAGAMAAGFLFKTESAWWPNALFILGILVVVSSGLTLFVRFSPACETDAQEAVALAQESEGSLAGA